MMPLKTKRIVLDLRHLLCLRISIALSLMIWNANVAICQETSDVVIVEEFVGGKYDESKWMIDLRKVPEATFDISAAGMSIHVPAIATGGKEAELRSRFKIDGNFEISVKYSLKSFPKPEQSSLKFDIALDGPAGLVALRRTEHSSRGTGYSVWNTLNENDKFKFFELESNSKDPSELMVRRTDGRLELSVRSSSQDEYRKLETVQYPSYVDNVRLRVVGSKVSKPVQVIVHSVHITADETWTIKELQSDGKSNYGVWIVCIVVGLLIVTVVVFVVLRMR